MRFTSAALFAGAFTRTELERVRDYLTLRLDRALNDTSFSGAHCVAVERELAIIETALACLPLPGTPKPQNDNLLPEGR